MSDTELRPGYYVDVRAKVMDVDGDRCVVQIHGSNATLEVPCGRSMIVNVIPRSSDTIARDPQFQSYLARLLESRANVAPLKRRAS